MTNLAYILGATLFALMLSINVLAVLIAFFIGFIVGVLAQPLLDGSTTASIRFNYETGTNVYLSGFPLTEGAGDDISLSFEYEAA